MVKIPAVQKNNIYEVMNNKTCSFVGRNMLNTSANVSLCRLSKLDLGCICKYFFIVKIPKRITSKSKF